MMQMMKMMQQMGQMAQMMKMMQQMSQMSQMGQMGQMGGEQMQQMAQMSQMAQANQMGEEQMKQMAQMRQMAQMSQMGEMMGQMGQMGQMGEMMSQMGQMGGASQSSPEESVMSSWASASAAADSSAGSEQPDDAMSSAMKATQEAIIMQQVQFMQQMKAQQQAELTRPVSGPARFIGGSSRFKDDYRAFKLCMHHQQGMCWQGARCVYAHTYDELHPASPDMPEDIEVDNTALAKTSKEEEHAPVMRLRKKRDLCRKFMDSGHSSRGNACPNAHGEAEIGKTAFVLYDKVKLEVCKAWEARRCSYGNKCIYAHGDHEIGQKRRDWDAPPIKKKKESQSVEEWRREILKDPDGPAFPDGGPY